MANHAGTQVTHQPHTPNFAMEAIAPSRHVSCLRTLRATLHAPAIAQLCFIRLMKTATAIIFFVTFIAAILNVSLASVMRAESMLEARLWLLSYLLIAVTG